MRILDQVGVSPSQAFEGLAPDTQMLPVLQEAGLVDPRFTHIVPAVVFGRAPKGDDEGSVGVGVGNYPNFARAIEEAAAKRSDVFNPHSKIKKRAHQTARGIPGKGSTFALSSYLLSDGQSVELIPEATDAPWLTEDTARGLMETYDLGSITVARTVRYRAEQPPEITPLGAQALLPLVVREAGARVYPHHRTLATRAEALRRTFRNLGARS